MKRVSAIVVTALFVVGLSAVLAACGGEPASTGDAGADAVTLQLNWFHEAEFVGYYMADAEGFYADEGLDVDILEGGPGDPAIDRVLDGRAGFGISSFGEQRDAVVRGRPVVAVASTFQIPPLVIFSLAESGIREPADLVGRRAGVTTDYWKGVLEDTLTAAGVDPSAVEAVSVDTGDLQPLFDGDVDAWLGYAQDEPIKAEVAGYEVATIFPADYGVGGYEGLVLVRQETLDADLDLVSRFVRASERGWRYAVEHPDEAAAVLLEWAPDPGLEFQRLAVRAVAPLVDTPQAPIGWIDEARWRRLMGDAYDAENPGYSMSASAPER
jgi:ABC-type nitrate/sulfonate/bicarbonate transport system substrate-binding protein